MIRTDDLNSVHTSALNSPTKKKVTTDSERSRDLDEPANIVADIEDLMVGSSFFSEPDIESPDLSSSVSLNNIPMNETDPVADGHFLSLFIENVTFYPVKGSLPTVHLSCRSSDKQIKVKLILKGMWIDCDYRAGTLIHLTPRSKINLVPDDITIDDNGFAQNVIAIDDNGLVQDVIVIDDNGLYLIYAPDRLVSITTVADAVSCIRKAALTLQMQPLASDSKPTIHLATGSIIHEVFEDILQQARGEPLSLDMRLKSAIHRNVLTVYACGVDEQQATDHILSILKNLPSWYNRFMRDTPHPEAKLIDELRANLPTISQRACIPKVYALEESVSSRRYGLKGKMDALILLRFPAADKDSIISMVVPLELKTGKVTNSTAHRAQTLLYTLLLADRYGLKINYGLLYYMATDMVLRIRATEAEIRALLMIRNRIASATVSQSLPRPINNPYQCKQCAQLANCATMLRLEEGRESDGSGSVDIANNAVLQAKIKEASELVDNGDFFRKWNRLVSLEEEESRRIVNFQSAISAKLIACNVEAKSKSFFGRITAHFQLSISSAGDLHNGDPARIADAAGNEVGIGFIESIMGDRLVVNCDRNISKALYTMAKDPSQLEIIDVLGSTLLISKDELMTGFTTSRSNLVQLHNPDKFQLYNLLVASKPPRFLVKEAPLVEFEGLDSDQVEAITLCLNAQDYALILGMPGTGKTTTLVSLIRHLTLTAGQRILVSAYTHSAVDNLLMKLKSAGISVLRLGNGDRINERLAEDIPNSQNFPTVASIRKALADRLVVGVTALGSNHAALAGISFDYAIIDEASQITVPSVVGPLLRAEKFILVGDHYQLPPLIRSSAAVTEGLNVSLFKILADAHPSAVAILSKQFRMCEDIQLIANKTVYNDMLRCGSEEVANGRLTIDLGRLFCKTCGDAPDCWLRTVLDSSRRVIFLDTDELPAREESETSSFANQKEALLIGYLVQATLSCDISAEQLCIIAPYRPQIRLLQSMPSIQDIEVSTVDRYQGRDKDCVIISFVRSNSSRCIGSLLSDWHRLNVAITRARRKLIMLGSWSTIMEHPQMAILRDLLMERGWVVRLPSHALEHDSI